MNSTRRILTAVLAALLLALGVLAWRQYQELIVLRNRAAVGDPADLLKRLAAAQKRIHDLQDQLAAKIERVRAANRDLAKNGAGPDGAGGPPPNWRGGFRAAMNDPKFLQLMSVGQKLALDSKYASLFKNLSQNYSLTPQQLDQFKNLLVQKQQAVMDAVQAAREQGVNPRTDPAEFQQAVTAAQSSVEQQIESALGAGAYAQYQQYEQTIPQRNTVTSVQQELSYSSSPLTDDQANQLIQILAQDKPAGGQTSSSNLRSILNNNASSPITPQAMTDASSVLAPAQMQALQQVQAAQQARQQAQQLLRASMTAGK